MREEWAEPGRSALPDADALSAIRPASCCAYRYPWRAILPNRHNIRQQLAVSARNRL